MAEHVAGAEKQEVLPFIEETYQRASALYLIEQEIIKAGQPITETNRYQGEWPEPTTGRLALLQNLHTAVLVGQSSLEVPEDLIDEVEVREAGAILACMSKTPEEIVDLLVTANKEWKTYAENFARDLGKYSLHILASRPYADALRRINLSGEAAFPQLDTFSLDMLMERTNARRHNDGQPRLVIAQLYPEQVLDWLARKMETGDAEGYKEAARLWTAFSDGVNSQSTYPDAYRVACAIPDCRSTVSIGIVLGRQEEYAPQQFNLKIPEMRTLKKNKFMPEEIFDIAANPVLKRNVLEKTVAESDEEMSESIAEIYDTGVNILEYLDYLLKTGGIFAPGSTQTLKRRLSDYDHNETYAYASASGVWNTWRSESSYTPQQILDAWTIADTVMPKDY